MRRRASDRAWESQWDSAARMSAARSRTWCCSTTTLPPSSAPSRRGAASTRTSRSSSASCSQPICRRCCSWLGGGGAVAFHFMAVGQLLLTYPSRHTWTRPLSNIYLHAAVVAGVVIQLAAASLPLSADLLGDARLPPQRWPPVL